MTEPDPSETAPGSPPPAAAPRRWWTRRAEWAIRLMRLPVSADPPDAPGLLMIQIDGLGRGEAERAIDAGRMPTLARLQRAGGWSMVDFHAGLPASTPAVQGELFYGVPTAVPAFSFVERATGRERRMYDPDAAKAVEARLAKSGPGLLAGGSAYGDIYTGGAAEAHFCAASLGLSDLAKAANPLALLALLLSNLVMILRTMVLAVVEIGLALVDAARGVVALGELWQELKFVPTRVAIAVLMRDALTLGAGIDLARGLPIVHVNYLGYDEQAHRRGPQSAFAHWALKGIDRAVGRLVRAAERAPRRRYRVVVYSDHGQLAVTPYPERAGRTIEEAVAAVLRGQGAASAGPAPPDARERGEQTGRAGYLGGRRFQRLFPDRPDGAAAAADAVRVAAMGPVAHVYLPTPPGAARRDAVAAALVAEAGVPMVLAPERPGDAAGPVAVWQAGRRRTRLPDDPAGVLGADHPFLEAAAGDLAALVRHPDAGDLVLVGWAPGADVDPVSFPYEHGAHAGPSPAEMRGFVLLPPGVEAAAGPIRPAALRALALRVLSRSDSGADAVDG